MIDHVTLFGAGSSSKVIEHESGDGARLLACGAEKPPEDQSIARDAGSLTAWLKRTGGILVQERTMGTSAELICSTFPMPTEGARPPGRALLLRIRGADRMEPLRNPMSLSIGDHLILPVDGEAEAALEQFHSMVQRFPEETRRLILASLRRPTLDWEVDQLRAMLGGKGDGSSGEPGAARKARSHWFVGAMAALGVILLAGVTAGGYFALKSFGVARGQGSPTSTSSITAPPPPPPPPSASTQAPELSEAQKFDALMKDLLTELDTAAPTDPDMKALREKLKDSEWKKNQEAGWVLAVLFHGALGSKLDAQAYQKPSQSKMLQELLKQSLPARTALLSRAVCETKPQPPLAGLPKGDKCTPDDLKGAAHELEWIVQFLKHKSSAGVSAK